MTARAKQTIGSCKGTGRALLAAASSVFGFEAHCRSACRPLCSSTASHVAIQITYRYGSASGTSTIAVIVIELSKWLLAHATIASTRTACRKAPPFCPWRPAESAASARTRSAHLPLRAYYFMTYQLISLRAEGAAGAAVAAAAPAPAPASAGSCILLLSIASASHMCSTRISGP